MASVSRNAQVSKSETRTTPATDFAQYTRFELEEFAREQVALVANYQRFVLNQRDIIASLEQEIKKRDDAISYVIDKLDKMLSLLGGDVALVRLGNWMR